MTDEKGKEIVEGTPLDMTVFLLFLEFTKTLDENGKGDQEELVEFYSRLTGDSMDGAGALSYRAFIGGIKTGLKYADEHPIKQEETKQPKEQTHEEELDLSWIRGKEEQPLGA